jgi:hypothetical protein
MKLSNVAHTSRPWRIHELTRDFRLEEVRALPTPGGPEDFPRLVQQMTSGGPQLHASAPAAREAPRTHSRVGNLRRLSEIGGPGGFGLFLLKPPSKRPIPFEKGSRVFLPRRPRDTGRGARCTGCPDSAVRPSRHT